MKVKLKMPSRLKPVNSLTESRSTLDWLGFILVKPRHSNGCHSWTAVATWRWVANDDNCGICRMAFDGCCPDCKLPGDDCPLVWGECSHCFHIHCIVKWLNSQQVNQLCPMCRQDWKFKE
ncbi:anaphase-promoting complex subunit 11-like isoform X2 [Dreissena polymorpha]|uniref:anaphase-promoting complex subunit 11-like isoform X2 n=1 Tax=Dreissena polymorpha TaxID=45954 RepID=UPI002264DCF3|nr:anaphase-promoting complex subunit 11-like isoform X2 [Dreissena polymorpha]